MILKNCYTLDFSKIREDIFYWEDDMYQGWIGVDLDGTLAYYDQWRGADHIGEPVPLMLQRVKDWLEEKKHVKIVTARRALDYEPGIRVIEDWCIKHLGVVLEITDKKDFNMIELWDDRAVRVEQNTGIVITKEHR